MSRKFLLPHSKLLPYSLDYWGEVKQCLSQLLTSKHDNEADFTNFILKMLQQNGVNDKVLLLNSVVFINADDFRYLVQEKNTYSFSKEQNHSIVQ